MARLVCLLSAALLFAMPAFGQPAEKPARDPDLAERAWIASAAYHAVKRYFAHWEGLPADYDFDARYRAALAEGLASPDRRGFTLAMTRLFASLENGHTGFTDLPLQDQAGDMPFRAQRMDGKWVVTRSTIPALNPGDVIVAVDGQPVDSWLKPVRSGIAQSDDFARDRLTWISEMLFPRRFTLGLQGGRSVPIDLDSKSAGPMRGRMLSRESGVVRIPSFDDPKFEQAAIEAVRNAGDAKAILFDVRNNGGGSTPVKLLETVMTKPYRGTLVATPLTVAEFDARAVFDPEDHPFPKGMIRYGPQTIAPRPDAVATPMAVLADGGCGSACEDFIARFQDGKRGPLMGERSFGSTGQPYMVQFPEFGMNFRVSTKRESLPNGRQLEGRGVLPDVAIPLTLEEIRSGKDVQLETAVKRLLAQP
jgi:carboxyl-terminal processing protease